MSSLKEYVRSLGLAARAAARELARASTATKNSALHAMAASLRARAGEILEANARDLAAFLSWAADPSLEARKRIGWQVMLYLLITTVLMYLAKRRIWASAH